ncbi:MAG TPA: transglutaminase-like domain-containing protein [Polyangiales bacterium]
MTRLARAGMCAVCASVAACLLVGCEAPKPHTFIPAFSPKELAAFGVAAPTSIVSDGKQLTRPQGGPLRTGEEQPMLAGPAAQRGVQEPGRRALGFRPDRVTELEGTLGYFEVFTPAVAPFKRVSALDAVVLDGPTPVLTVADPARRPLPIEGLEAAPPDARVRDRFWGSVVLDFSEGSVVPLPSVSPESRLLHVELEPAAALSFARDGADNFYAVANEASRALGQIRVTYVIDAPRDYFGAALPGGDVSALASEVPPLPEKVQRDALAFARELGLSRGTELARALAKLVEHFRSFEESRLAPADTGNILLDLARGKRGVCRHRAYAFVIVAQALGVPARFVQNEAHAWVEVKLPQLSYMRIDLGGAAAGLNPHALEDKPFYRPQVEDPWPRPRVYQESYARAEQALQTGASAGVQVGNAGARGRNDSALKPTLSRAQSRASLESQLPDERTPVVLNVSRYVPEVLRGSSFEVEGSARLRSGLPVAGLRVEVSLSSTQTEQAVLLGVAVTDEQGTFRGMFTVPPSIDPADYALVVVTPGDARHAAARAD